MNAFFFNLINVGAGHIGIIDALMVFCAQWLWILMTIGVVIAFLQHMRRFRDMFFVTLGSAIVARLGVAEIIRALYYHPRPYWVIPVNLLLDKETISSFPSGHTIFIFALATGVYLFNRPVGKWYLWLAALVGFSRVWVGVHWPFDIIGGAALGIATTLICFKYYEKYKSKLLRFLPSFVK